MRLLRLIAVVLGALVPAAVPLAAGCGSEFTLAEAGAAIDVTGREAGSGLDAPPAPDGPIGAFCNALSEYYTRCQFTRPCDQRNLENCVVYGNALSDVARAAFTECQSMIGCVQGAGWVHEQCVRAKLTAATPTMAQAKLQNDYCSTCPQAGASCSSTFYSEGAVQLLDGQGFDSLLYDDMLVSVVDKTCVNTLMCLNFRSCEDTYLTSQVPADSCRD